MCVCVCLAPPVRPDSSLVPCMCKHGILVEPLPEEMQSIAHEARMPPVCLSVTSHPTGRSGGGGARGWEWAPPPQQQEHEADRQHLCCCSALRMQLAGSAVCGRCCARPVSLPIQPKRPRPPSQRAPAGKKKGKQAISKLGLHALISLQLCPPAGYETQISRPCSEASGVRLPCFVSAVVMWGGWAGACLGPPPRNAPRTAIQNTLSPVWPGSRRSLADGLTL